MTNLEKLEADIRGKLPRLEYYINNGFGDFKFENHIKLNDVLEWLGIEYMINGKGTICKWSDEEYRYIPQDNWNISEPLLKNQDQSVINYLAGLI